MQTMAGMGGGGASGGGMQPAPQGPPASGGVPEPSQSSETPHDPSDPAVSSGDPPASSEPGFDAGSDPNRNNIQPGQMCARLAQIQCAGEQHCCDSPGRDRAACETELSAACREEVYFDAMSQDPKTGFDTGAAAAALGRAEELAATCDPSLAAFMASPSGITSVFRGTVSPGQSCSPGLRGTAPEVAAASLASCTGIATTACLPISAFTWTCTPRGGVGELCFTDLNCQEGMYCPNPDLMIDAANCAARKPLGTRCAEGNECESLFCGGGVCVEPDAQLAYCLDT
ncbi:MAG: hypothetical protein OXR73_31530 [Myxococcales bacterium]|nr:hypothetical protein [Myxococcales bacterium]